MAPRPLIEMGPPHIAILPDPVLPQPGAGVFGATSPDKGLKPLPKHIEMSPALSSCSRLTEAIAPSDMPSTPGSVAHPHGHAKSRSRYHDDPAGMHSQPTLLTKGGWILALSLLIVQLPFAIFTLLLPAKLDGRLENVSYGALFVPLLIGIFGFGMWIWYSTRYPLTSAVALMGTGLAVVAVSGVALKLQDDADNPSHTYSWVLILGTSSFPLALAWLMRLWDHLLQVFVDTPRRRAMWQMNAQDTKKTPTTTEDLHAAHTPANPIAKKAETKHGDQNSNREYRGCGLVLRTLLAGSMFVFIKIVIEGLVLLCIVLFLLRLGTTLDDRENELDTDSRDYSQAFVCIHYGVAFLISGIAWCCVLDHGMWPVRWGRTMLCYDHYLDDQACLYTISEFLLGLLGLLPVSIALAILQARFEEGGFLQETHYEVFVPIYVEQLFFICLTSILAFDPFKRNSLPSASSSKRYSLYV